MEQSAIKDELLGRLAQIDEEDLLEYLRSIKEEIGVSKDLYSGLSVAHKEGIERGLKDIKEGRTIPHSDVVKKYGLEI